MNKKSFKIIISYILVLASALMMTGCGPSVDLTEEENRKIAEYAAGLLLKYDKNYSGSLVNIPEEEPDEFIINEKPAPVVEEVAPEVIDENNNIQGNGDSSGNKAETSYSDVPMAAALSMEGFDITYTGYEMKSVYPDQEGTDLVFSLQAEAGKTLLVLHFNVSNISGADSILNMVALDEKYRLIFNGADRVNCQKTILMNDLDQVYEQIPAGGNMDCVLLFEISEEQAGSIQSMDLNIINGENKYYYQLQ